MLLTSDTKLAIDACGLQSPLLQTVAYTIPLPLPCLILPFTTRMWPSNPTIETLGNMVGYLPQRGPGGAPAAKEQNTFGYGSVSCINPVNHCFCDFVEVSESK